VVVPFPSLAEMRPLAARLMVTQRLVYPQKETAAPLGLMAARLEVAALYCHPCLARISV